MRYEVCCSDLHPLMQHSSAQQPGALPPLLLIIPAWLALTNCHLLLSPSCGWHQRWCSNYSHTAAAQRRLSSNAAPVDVSAQSLFGRHGPGDVMGFPLRRGLEHVLPPGGWKKSSWMGFSGRRRTTILDGFHGSLAGSLLILKFALQLQRGKQAFTELAGRWRCAGRPAAACSQRSSACSWLEQWPLTDIFPCKAGAGCGGLTEEHDQHHHGNTAIGPQHPVRRPTLRQKCSERCCIGSVINLISPRMGQLPLKPATRPQHSTQGRTCFMRRSCCWQDASAQHSVLGMGSGQARHLRGHTPDSRRGEM